MSRSLWFVVGLILVAIAIATCGGSARSVSAAGPTELVVTPGMTCWGIAEQFTGDGTRCSELCAINADVIEASAKSRGMPSSDNCHWIFSPGMTLQLPASWAKPVVAAAPSVIPLAVVPTPAPATPSNAARSQYLLPLWQVLVLAYFLVVASITTSIIAALFGIAMIEACCHAHHHYRHGLYTHDGSRDYV